MQPPRMQAPLGASTAAVSMTPLASSPIVASSGADQSSGWLPQPMLASGGQGISRHSLPSSNAPYIAQATPISNSLQQVPYAPSTGSLSVESDRVSNQMWQSQTNAGLAFHNPSFPTYSAPHY